MLNVTLSSHNESIQNVKQECIPVGCLPSATVTVCCRGEPGPGGGGVWSGGCQGGAWSQGGLLQGVPGPGGVCSGECLVPGGVCTLSHSFSLCVQLLTSTALQQHIT